MDTIFTLPLFLLAAFQALLSLLLLAPNAVSLPVARLIRSVRRITATAAVTYTIAGALTLLFISSMMELVKGADRIQSANLRGEALAIVDYLRAQVSCVLSAANVLLLFLNMALGADKCALDGTQKNLEAMKRQVKGLQAEYERVTTASSADSGKSDGAVAGEAAALRKQVDRLIQEKTAQQAACEAAEAAAKTANAKVTAMVKQVKGMEAEFDRILDENKQLRRRVAQLDTSAAADPAFHETSKKDD